MELKFTQAYGKLENGCAALFLAAIIGTVLAALDWLYLLPAALAGVLIPLVYPLIPKEKRRLAIYILAGLHAAFLGIRFPAILDGMKLLANRMFRQSEMIQSYEYDYFVTTGDSAVEATLWLTIFFGILCALWPNRVNAVLAGLWIAAMAYFGVTPDAVWLVFLVLAGFLNVLPRQTRWFYGIGVTVLVIALGFAVTRIAPQPINAVSAVDDRLRDAFAVFSVTGEQTPIPTEVPEPETVPRPDSEPEQPDHGVQHMAFNLPFLILAALTLALLFIPAVIKDGAEKRRQKNRAGFRDEDASTAIKAMYLYAQRWRKLSDTAGEVPPEVYALWQEAAFSDHVMTLEQRELMRSYMEKTAKTVWEGSGIKKRLFIRYRVAL